MKRRPHKILPCAESAFSDEFRQKGRRPEGSLFQNPEKKKRLLPWLGIEVVTNDPIYIILDHRICLVREIQRNVTNHATLS